MTVLLVAAALTQAPAACKPAGSAVRVEGHLQGLNDVVYTVRNRSSEPIRWIRMGTSAGFVLEASEQPAIAQAHPGWTGVVVRDEDGHTFMVWRAAPGAELPAGSRARFVITVRESRIIPSRNGIPPSQWLLMFDYRSIPFTARATSGGCVAGVSANPLAYREGGRYSSMRGGAVRVLEQPGDDVVLIDVPLRENLGRITRGLYFTVPLAVTFGVSEGFSADMSMGVGLTWSPTPYLGASAKVSVGTFFFNNRTLLRGVGLDAAIPIQSRMIAENLRRHTRYFVLGVEYFRRDVSRWGGYMDGPQWYVSGSGVAVRGGIRRLGWSGP